MLLRVYVNLKERNIYFYFLGKLLFLSDLSAVFGNYSASCGAIRKVLQKMQQL